MKSAVRFRCISCRRWVSRGCLVKIRLGETDHVGSLVKTCKSIRCRQRAEREISYIVWKDMKK